MSAQQQAVQLEGVEFLSAFTAAERGQLAAATQTLHYELGDTIATAGDPADGLYVVGQGRIRLFRQVNGAEESVGVRKAGDVFAELSALRDLPHEVSVRASGNTEIHFIARDAIVGLCRANRKAEEFMSSYAALRAAGGVFSHLFNVDGFFSRDEVKPLITTVGIKSVEAGEVLLEQGSSDERRLFVVRSGQVALVHDSQGEGKPASLEVGKLEPGDLLGQRTCLSNQPQPARATALTACTLLVIPQQTILSMVKSSASLLEKLEEQAAQLDKEIGRQTKLRKIRSTPQLKFDINANPALGERVLKRFQLVHQAEEMDCGAACLAMVCKHYELSMTLGRLRDLVKVGREGATLDGIASAAESLGFGARGVQASFSAMQSFDLPFVAHWEGYHFVCVYGVSDEYVWIADPGPGFKQLTVEEFEKGWSGTCLLFDATDVQAKAAERPSPWWRFAGYLRPHTRTIGHMFLAALVIQLLNLAPPVITQNVFDRVIVHENANLLFYLMLALVLAQVFAQITTLTRGYLANFMTRSMDFAMMSGFFRHTLALPIAFFGSRRTGDVFARFQENQTIREFLTGQTVGTVLNVLMVFVYLTVMFLYSVKLTLILLALVVPIVILTVAITPRMKDYSRKVFEASTDAEATLMETITAAESIKGMGIERPARLKWEHKYAEALNVQYNAQGFHLKVGVASQLLNVVATTSVLYVGATMVIGQEISVGQLIAFNMLATSVMTPLLGLVGLWDELHAAGVAIERLSDVLDIEEEQTNAQMHNRYVLPELAGDIRFENVFFRYGDQDDPYVLKNVSFDIRAGEMVAIVGQSGSGKSTLAKMLVGFYPPEEGKIYVDGYALDQVEIHSYRDKIGYVMQSNLLLQGTIAENIALGQSADDIDYPAVVAAATLADAHRFISDLPRGYEHKVGERGVGLSGGQIQRICIARALYRDPALLIFDEATSALDTQSEQNILGSMDGILGGRTALVIAHRMSTILKADRILVLYDGEVVESGTHEELLAGGGMYRQLVASQLSSAA